MQYLVQCPWYVGGMQRYQRYVRYVLRREPSHDPAGNGSGKRRTGDRRQTGEWQEVDKERERENREQRAKYTRENRDRESRVKSKWESEVAVGGGGEGQNGRIGIMQWTRIMVREEKRARTLSNRSEMELLNE